MTALVFPRATRAEGIIGGDESFSRVPYDQLAGDGITALIRYIAGADKAMDRTEFEAAVAAGFRVAWVMETFAQAASFGYDQGVAEARRAYACADAIGWPADRPGYFVAEDPFPVARSAWLSVADYFRGVIDVGPDRPLPGAYGSGALCAYLRALGLIAHEWHVSTWPGCNRAVADIVQEANGLRGYSNFAGAIDLNTIRDDNPDWGQHPFSPTPRPKPPEEDDMSTAGILRTLYNWGGGVWCIDQGLLLPLHTDDQVHGYLDSGAVAVGDADDSYHQAAGGRIGASIAGGARHPAPDEALCALVCTAAAARPVKTIASK